ncbi:MAG: GNAT family N-acetyltransferase, partial [Nitrososphaerota archaeon]
IGNVIVKPNRRGEGIGKALVNKAIEHLEKKNVVTIGLYAYHDVIQFYEKFGFTRDREFVWLVCQKANWKGVPFTHVNAEKFERLLKLDERLFGASRRRLLKLLYNFSPSLCRVSFEGEELVAYLMGSEGDSIEIGPWAALPGYEKSGFDLFKSLADDVRGLKVVIGVPAWKREIVYFLVELGFERKFNIVRMYRGPPVPETECLFGIESLERG